MLEIADSALRWVPRYVWPCVCRSATSVCSVRGGSGAESGIRVSAMQTRLPEVTRWPGRTRRTARCP